MHYGIIVKVTNLKPHPNATQLQLTTFFGEQVVVGTDIHLEDIGIYFPSGLELSESYCDANHLCRTDSNGNKDTGYLDRDKRNVKIISLRGERSFGLYMPLSSLSFTGVDLNSFKESDHIEIVNKIPICCKYVPIHRPSAPTVKQNGKVRKKSAPIAPDFKEHTDTAQLMYNLDQFQSGDLIEISLKMHGTSARTAHTRVLTGYKRSLLDRILHREGKPIYEYGYVSGTRRTVLEDFNGGYYGDNKFREPAAKFFEGKLPKDMTIYYEIVGYTTNGKPIMPSSNIADPEAKSIYGDVMEFSYGCSPNGKKKLYGRDEEGYFMIEQSVPQQDWYIYRITQQLDDGSVIELSGDQVRQRCEELGCKYVPLLAKFVIPSKEELNGMAPGEYVQQIAEHYYDGIDPIGKSHVKEGVVIRIVDKKGFVAYKLKNNLFKLVTSNAISQIEALSIEETDLDRLSEI